MYVGYGYFSRGTDRVELWNNDRVLAYLAGDPLAGFNGLKNSSTSVIRDCQCPELRPLYCDPGAGPDGAFTDPATDEAPWYDPDVSDSADFAGLFVTDITGFDSTVRRSVMDSAILGGSLGPLRLGARQMTVTGWLRARTCCAAEYGLRWLQEALTGGSCEDCSLAELLMFKCCPGEGDDLDDCYLTNESQTPFNPTVSIPATLTDNGGGSYTFDVDDAAQIRMISDVNGAPNNTGGFLPTCLDGSDTDAIARFGVQVQDPGDMQTFFLWFPFDAITSFVTAPSGSGASASIDIDTTVDLGCDDANARLAETATALANWIVSYGSGVAVDIKTSGNGICYTENTGLNPFDFNRTIFRTGLINGPIVTDRFGSCCEDCGCTNLQVQFTLASESPFIYSDIDWCLEQVPIPTDVAHCLDLFCNECPEVEDPRLMLECGFDNFAPPAPFTPIDPCYCDPWVQYQMCCSLSNEQDWNEASAVVEIYAGNDRMLNVKLQAFQNPFGDDLPCPCDPDDPFWQCREPCAVLEIHEIPSGATLLFDSRQRVSTLTLPGGFVIGGSRLITGQSGTPFSWIDLSACTTLCMILTVDANHVDPAATVSIGVSKRYQSSGW